LWPRQGQKVKQKAANSGMAGSARLNPFRPSPDQHLFE
jgi:hypothetical protein